MNKSLNKSLYVAMALVIGALIASASSVFANSSFGKKLEIALNSDGKPKNLSMVYAYDQNWGWALTANTTIKDEDLVNVPERVTVKLMNLSSGKVFYTGEMSKKVLRYPSIVINSSDVLREFLPVQKDAALTIANAKGEYLYYLPLSDACSYSANVVNLSKTGMPACEVNPKDFANIKDQCADQKAKLLEYIKLGYTTCASAKEIYAKLGCGDLGCSL